MYSWLNDCTSLWHRNIHFIIRKWSRKHEDLEVHILITQEVDLTNLEDNLIIIRCHVSRCWQSCFSTISVPVAFHQLICWFFFHCAILHWTVHDFFFWSFPASLFICCCYDVFKFSSLYFQRMMTVLFNTEEHMIQEVYFTNRKWHSTWISQTKKKKKRENSIILSILIWKRNENNHYNLIFDEHIRWCSKVLNIFLEGKAWG